MLRSALSALAVALLALAGPRPAAAHGIHYQTGQACDYHIDYDVDAGSDGIAFTRDDAQPKRVFMHDGHLRVDSKPVAVSADDARSLRDYEHTTRILLRQAADVAREGVAIGYGALTTVVASFATDGEQRHDMVERLNRLHAQALTRIDDTLGRGEWHREAMDSLVEDTLSQAVPALVGSITSQAVSAALSGDQAMVERLKARADSLKSSIDHEVDQRSDELQRQAQAMCPHMDHLMALQQAWRFRVDGDQRLQLLHRAPEDADKDQASDQRSGEHHAAP